MLKIADPRDFGSADVEPGDRVFHSNLTLARMPPWDDSNRPQRLNDLVMAFGNAANIDLNLNGDQYEIQGHPGKYIMFIPSSESGQVMPVIAMDNLSVAMAKTMYGYKLADNARVLGVLVDTLCLVDRCTSFVE